MLYLLSPSSSITGSHLQQTRSHTIQQQQSSSKRRFPEGHFALLLKCTRERERAGGRLCILLRIKSLVCVCVVKVFPYTNAQRGYIRCSFRHVKNDWRKEKKLTEISVSLPFDPASHTFQRDRNSIARTKPPREREKKQVHVFQL